MFDIGFWELILIAMMGLVILGPQRLPGAIRSVTQTIAKVRAIATSAQEELNRELKVQELHDNLRKAEDMDMNKLSPELRDSVEQLKKAALEVTRPYADAKEQLKNSGEQLQQSVESLKNNIEKPLSLSSDKPQQPSPQDQEEQLFIAEEDEAVELAAARPDSKPKATSTPESDSTDAEQDKKS